MTESIVAFLERGSTTSGEEERRLARLLAAHGVHEADVRDLTRQEFRFRFSPDATPKVEPLREELPWGGLVILDFPEGAAPSVDLLARVHEELDAAATVHVRGHDHFRRERSTDGTFTVAVQRRKDGIDGDEFIQYYQDVYVPAVMAGLSNPPYDTYRTCVVLQSLGDFEWDGVTFNDYVDAATLREHMIKQVGEVSSRTTASNFVSIVEKYSGTFSGTVATADTSR